MGLFDPLTVRVDVQIRVEGIVHRQVVNIVRRRVIRIVVVGAVDTRCFASTERRQFL